MSKRDKEKKKKRDYSPAGRGEGANGSTGREEMETGRVQFFLSSGRTKYLHAAERSRVLLCVEETCGTRHKRSCRWLNNNPMKGRVSDRFRRTERGER